MNHKILICLSFLLATIFTAGGAFAITCTSDSTKTITLGSSELITVSCSGMSSGDNVEVTHSGYNPNCLTSSTPSKTLTYAAPSTTFSFDGLSTACQGNVAERTIGWSFDDGSNTYSSSTVATLSPLEITASFDSSSVSKTTSESAFYVTLTVSNAGSTAVSNMEVTETTSTGLLSSKTITSIPAQSSQSVSWSLTPSSVGTGTYSITARAKAPTTDATTDSMTLTITAGSTGSDDTPGDTSSPGSGPGGAPPLPPTTEEEDNVTTQKQKEKPDQEKVTASNRPNLVPGVGLRNNEKLQNALKNGLGWKKMSENAVQNMERLSASITANIETQRNLEATDTSSKVTTRMKYNGNGKVKNFIIYEKIPKSFAESTDDITVNTNGQVEIVEKDPEYAIIFSELNPDQTIEVSYTVNQKVDASVIDAMTSEVYAESIEEPPVDAEPTTTTTEEPEDKKTSLIVILSIVLALVAVAAYLFVKKRQKQNAPKRFVPAPIRQPENPNSSGSESPGNETGNTKDSNDETDNTEDKKDNTVP